MFSVGFKHCPNNYPKNNIQQILCSQFFFLRFLAAMLICGKISILERQRSVDISKWTYSHTGEPGR